MTTPNNIKQWIEAAMPDTTAEVEGDGRHFAAKVVSPAFEGKNTLARHRMVYAALGDKMDEEIHALSLETILPTEPKR